MIARITVKLKKGILDPEGAAISTVVSDLLGRELGDVRVGKYIEIDLLESDEAKARELIERICERTLANPVTEEYRYRIDMGEDESALK